MIHLKIKNRILPSNWETELNKYLVQDKDKISNEYNIIYDKQINQITNDVELNYIKD